MTVSLRSVLELPLLKRELIELAQRKRTYLLRCICLCAFALVFLSFYAELNSRAVNLMWMLGQGRQMSESLTEQEEVIRMLKSQAQDVSAEQERSVAEFGPVGKDWDVSLVGACDADPLEQRDSNGVSTIALINQSSGDEPENIESR